MKRCLGGLAGNIAEWKKKAGDEVAAGDSIAEVETDKVRCTPLAAARAASSVSLFAQRKREM